MPDHETASAPPGPAVYESPGVARCHRQLCPVPREPPSTGPLQQRPGEPPVPERRPSGTDRRGPAVPAPPPVTTVASKQPPSEPGVRVSQPAGPTGRAPTTALPPVRPGENLVSRHRRETEGTRSARSPRSRPRSILRPDVSADRLAEGTRNRWSRGPPRRSPTGPRSATANWSGDRRSVFRAGGGPHRSRTTRPRQHDGAEDGPIRPGRSVRRHSVWASPSPHRSPVWTTRHSGPVFGGSATPVHDREPCSLSAPSRCSTGCRPARWPGPPAESSRRPGSTARRPIRTTRRVRPSGSGRCDDLPNWSPAGHRDTRRASRSTRRRPSPTGPRPYQPSSAGCPGFRRSSS